MCLCGERAALEADGLVVACDDAGQDGGGRAGFDSGPCDALLEYALVEPQESIDIKKRGRR